MPAPRNTMAPQARNTMAPEKTTWYDPLIKFAIQKAPLPENDLPKRVFMETVRGDKSPITEQRFNPAQIAAIMDLIRNSNNMTGVGYDTYDKLAADMGRTGAAPRAYTADDLNDIKYTLGMFNYATPKTGGIRVTDDYDFNSEVPNVVSAFAHAGPIGVARAYGGRHIRPGQGRKVDILIGGRR